MSVAPDEFQAVLTKGEAKPIAIPDIEAGLTKLWSSAADKDGDNAVTRACVLNFIVYAGGEQDIQRATDTVAQFTLSHPSRGIVLVTEPNAPDGLKSWISAHCQLPSPDGKQVCCEQITLEASGATLDAMASVVTPLLVSDLPVVVWWPGQPQLEGVLFDHLMSVADRLIVDSSEFEESVSATLNKLASLASQRYQGVNFNDLNWARLTTWREMIAQFFDDAAFLPYLSTIGTVSLEYGRTDPSKNPNAAQALMLVVWLASRLNWQTIPNLVPQRTDAGYTTVLSHRGRPVRVDLKPVDWQKESVNGTLSTITLHATSGGKTAVFSVSASKDSDHATATVSIDGQAGITRTVSMPQETEIDLLNDELAMVNRDRTYERTLEVAGRLATNLR